MKKIIYLLLPSLFVAQMATAQITKRVLVEKFTSSACGNCPDGTAKLIGITDANPNVIWVSHHAGWFTDPMLFAEIDTIADAFTNGAPKACIDRVKFSTDAVVATDRANWSTHVGTQQAQTAAVEVIANGAYNPTTKMAYLSVSAVFDSPLTAEGDFRFNVFVVEDSLVGPTGSYNQSNYFNNTAGHYYQGAGQPILNYAHRHVTRAVLSSAWGTSNIIPVSPVVGETYAAEYSFEVPADYVEKNVRFVVFITDFSNSTTKRTVLNANQSSLLSLPQITATTQIPTTVQTLRLAPNPVQQTTVLTLESTETQTVQLSILDVTGRNIGGTSTWELQAGENQKSINVAHLPKGIYFLQLFNQKTNTTTRIIKVD